MPEPDCQELDGGQELDSRQELDRQEFDGG